MLKKKLSKNKLKKERDQQNGQSSMFSFKYTLIMLQKLN